MCKLILWFVGFLGILLNFGYAKLKLELDGIIDLDIDDYRTNKTVNFNIRHNHTLLCYDDTYTNVNWFMSEAIENSINVNILDNTLPGGYQCKEIQFNDIMNEQSGKYVCRNDIGEALDVNINVVDITIEVNGRNIIDSQVTLNSSNDYNITCSSVNGNPRWRVPNGVSENIIYGVTILFNKITIDELGTYVCSDGPTERKLHVYVQGDNLLAPLEQDVIQTVLLPNNQLIIPCRPTTPDVEVDFELGYGDYVNYSYNPRVGFIVNTNTLSHYYGGIIPIVCYFKRNMEYKVVQLYLQLGRIEDDESFNKEDISYNPKIGFTVPFTKTGDHNYRCIGIKGDAREVSSDDGLLWIRSIQEIKDNISIANVPLNAIVGSTVKVTCTVYKSDGYNCTMEKKDDRYVVESKYSVSTSICTSVLTISNLKENDSIQSCLVTYDKSQRPIEKSINITISYPNATLDQVSIKPPDEKQRCLGNRYEWILHLNQYPNLNWKLLNEERDVSNNNEYSVEVASIYDGRRYQVKVTTPCTVGVVHYTLLLWNDYHNKSYTLTLEKEGPMLLVAPMSISEYYVKGNINNITCLFTGYPLKPIVWTFTPYCDEQNDDCHTKIIKPTNRYLNESTVMSSVMLDDTYSGGNITCQSNYVKQTHQYMVFDVSNGFDMIIPNTIHIIDNHHYSIDTGDVLDLKCLASKNKYINNFTWKHKSNETYETILENSKLDVKDASTKYSFGSRLIMYDVTVQDGGDYICSVYNNTGQSETRSVSLVVRAPMNIQLFTNLEQDVTLQQYSRSMQLYCLAEGIPIPNITWYKDTIPIETNAFTKIYSESNYEMRWRNTTLYIDINTLNNDLAGSYSCIAYNGREPAISKHFNVTMEKAGLLSPLAIVCIAIIFTILIILVIYLLWKIRKERSKRKKLKNMGLDDFNKGRVELIRKDLGLFEQANYLPYNEAFEFPFEHLKLDQHPLGAGAFGVVYRGEARGLTDAEQTTVVAVKTLKQADDHMLKAFADELKIMCNIGQHLNIVNLLGACTKYLVERKLFILVEYCEYGSLRDYMLEHRKMFINLLNTNSERMSCVNMGYNNSCTSNFLSNSNDMDVSVNTATTQLSSTGTKSLINSNYAQATRTMTSKELIYWAYQVSCGMEYLASRKVLHGDLATRNILLAKDNIVKIADFGLARKIIDPTGIYTKDSKAKVPIKWLAIECLSSGTFSTQSDVWAYGVVLWELFSLAQTPYSNINCMDVLREHLTAGMRLPMPPYANDELYDLMLECWHEKPLCRPSFTELKNKLGTMLEEQERRTLEQLNRNYIEANERRLDKDYMDFFSSPDYKNVTSAPYSETDDSGYLMPADSFRASTTRTNMTDGEVHELELMLPNREMKKMNEEILEKSKKINSFNAKSVSNPTYAITGSGDDKLLVHNSKPEYQNV